MLSQLQELSLIIGCVATIVGGLIYLFSLIFRVGILISKLETNQTVLEDKVSKLLKLFSRLENHSERLTRIETTLDIESRNNGKFQEEEH